MSQARLLQYYDSASPNAREAGLSWYNVANIEAHAIANDTGLKVDVVCGVIAALSPNVKWEHNLSQASALCAWYVGKGEMPVLTTYRNGQTKAVEILQTGEVFPTLRGPKVVAFYHNLMGNLDVITVDTHIYNAWHGARVFGSAPLRNTPRKAEREGVREAIARIAVLRGVKPAQVQAVIWCAWIERIAAGKVEGYER